MVSDYNGANFGKINWIYFSIVIQILSMYEHTGFKPANDLQNILA